MTYWLIFLLIFLAFLGMIYSATLTQEEVDAELDEYVVKRIKDEPR